MKKIVLLLFSMISLIGYSQGQIEMADAMKESGKIYVVIGVVLTILIGIIIYLVLLDKKISNMEKKIGK